MRLLNCHTLELKDFVDNEIPPYSILSHRWGEDEVSYKNFRKGRQLGAGYRKIIDFCRFMRARGTAAPGGFFSARRKANAESVDWVWIDTCCIDKRSSAELSEAINSMYRWYGAARECIVYLVDVPRLTTDWGELMPAFRKSSWFTRGWALQELLAPGDVTFCTQDWEVLGHKCLWSSRCRHDHEEYGPILTEEISSITNIGEEYFDGRLRVGRASIAQKMSWAARRQTTRIEDEAYCLLGIFGINMPLLYGEREGAFRRLQEELIRRSSDQSIFAWKDYDYQGHGMLATSPKQFESCRNVVHRRNIVHRYEDLAFPYSITNRGIEMRCKPWKAVDLGDGFEPTTYFIKLNCRNGRSLSLREQVDADARAETSSSSTQFALSDRLMILLQPVGQIGSDQYVRVPPHTLPSIPSTMWREIDPTELKEMLFIVRA